MKLDFQFPSPFVLNCNGIFALFYLCLASNAICLQLFKFSGKSGGAFTFPSNIPDLPHMNERFALFYLCLVPNAICLQLFKFSGKSGGAFTFPSNFPDLPHMNERFRFSFSV